MERKKFPHQRFVWDFIRIKGYLDCFGMSGRTFADFFIGWRFNMSAGISRYRIENTRDRQKRRLYAPKTASGKCCGLLIFHMGIVSEMLLHYWNMSFLTNLIGNVDSVTLLSL